MPPVVRRQVPVPAKKTTTRKGSILDRPMEDPFGINNPFISLSLYGSSGTGKTTLWSSFPGPILVILCSGGKIPGELKSVAVADRAKIKKVYTIEEPQDILEIADMQQNTGTYATTIMDHSTDLQGMVLAQILGLKKAPPQLSWGLATREQWGQVSLQTREYLERILDLNNCNRVIVSQQREDEPSSDSDIALPTIGPALTPRTAGWLNPACDYICQTFLQGKTEVRKTVMKNGKTSETTIKVKGVNYCLRTGPNDLYTTKFRVPKGTYLPDYIVDPSYDKILALIKGKKI